MKLEKSIKLKSLYLIDNEYKVKRVSGFKSLFKEKSYNSSEETLLYYDNEGALCAGRSWAKEIFELRVEAVQEAEIQKRDAAEKLLERAKECEKEAEKLLK